MRFVARWFVQQVRSEVSRLLQWLKASRDRDLGARRRNLSRGRRCPLLREMTDGFECEIRDYSPNKYLIYTNTSSLTLLFHTSS